MHFKIQEKTSRIFGATLIIAGTTIGAGMLAMPLTAASIGYKNSLILLFFMSILMFFSALIHIDLFKDYPQGISFASLVEVILGRRYKIFPILIKCLLFYSLLAAYITGGSSVLGDLLNTNTSLHLSSIQIIFFFSIVFGILISMPTKIMDTLNRFFVILLFIFFFTLLTLFYPSTHVENLTLQNSFDGAKLIHAIPVFFTAYGFHGSIPTLVDYLNKDKKSLIKSFFWGSLITLIGYVLWQTSVLALLTSTDFNALNETSNLTLVLNSISIATNDPIQNNILLNCFYFLVIATSFIGVGIGQFNYIMEVIKPYMKTCSDFYHRTVSAVITIGVPLVFALFYPHGFIMALSFAGIWLCFLAIILPCIMSLYNNKSTFLMSCVSLTCLVFGVALLIIEVILKLQ